MACRLCAFSCEMLQMGNGELRCISGWEINGRSDGLFWRGSWKEFDYLEGETGRIRSNRDEMVRD